MAYPLVNQRSLHLKGHPQMDEAEIDERVREALRFVELEGTLDKYPSELSGGMAAGRHCARHCDRAAGAYDSPTAGLDPITANTIVTLIVKDATCAMPPRSW